jgi:hypothetical protein
MATVGEDFSRFALDVSDSGIIAERFLKKLAAGNSDGAERLVTKAFRQRYGHQELRRLAEKLPKFGEDSGFSFELVESQVPDEMVFDVTIRGVGGQQGLCNIQLLREEGKWRVNRLILTNTATSSSIHGEP